MVTCRFGVRPEPNGGSDFGFEVFDRMTGAAVASGMRQAEAEADARRRNHDTSGPPVVWPDPPELAVLRTVIDRYVTRAARHSRILVAQAAQALDELRAELAHAERAIAEHQARIGQLYKLFPDPDADVR